MNTNEVALPRGRNSKEAVAFLEVLRPEGPWTIAAMTPDANTAPEVKTYLGRRERLAMFKWIKRRNGKKNLYYMPNPVRRRMDKKPLESDISHLDYSFIDGDPLDGETPREAQERHRLALKSGIIPEPTFIYNSGNGVVALWRMEDRTAIDGPEDIALAKSTNIGIIEALGGKAKGVDSCQNLDRLLRLPHTINLPDRRKRVKGRKPALAGDVQYNPERAYCEFDFPAPVSRPTKTLAVADIGSPETTEDLASLGLSARLCEIIQDGRVDGEIKESDNSRSAWRFEAICGMIRSGLRSEVILGLLTDDRHAISERILEAPNPTNYARKEIQRIRARVRNSVLGDFDLKDDSATSEERVSRRPRFQAWTLAELRELPPVEYLVELILPRNSLFELYGKEKSGKTFFALGLGLSVATGTNFHGSKTRPGRVLHIIGEGNKTSFRNRIEAWIKANATDKAHRAELERLVNDNFYVVPMPMHLDSEADVKEFLAANPSEWSLITIDTLMRNMVGHISDPKDMAAFVRGCDTLREKTGAAVFVLHHEGKDSSKGGMGSINLNAAVDGIAKFERKPDGSRVFRVVTLRDGDDDLPDMIFQLTSIPLETIITEDGTDLSTRSATLELVGKKLKVAKHLNAADRLLLEIHETNPRQQTELIIPSERSKQSVSKLIKQLRERGYVEQDTYELTPKGAARAEEISK